MSGTNYSKPSLRQLTQLGFPLRWRVVGFVAAVAVGALLIGRIDTSVWRRVKQLERDFAAIKTERFYHAVQIRSVMRQLNDDLFRYHLKGDQADLRRFQAGEEQFQQWIIARRDEADSPQELALFRQIETDFANYVSKAAELPKRPAISFLPQTRLDEINQTLRQIAAPVLDQADRLMEVQRQSFNGFFSQSQSTLESLEHLILVSLVLLVTLAILVVGLVYRGMIAPLQLKLSESQAAMLRQEKLAALGGLAAGVAHEIRNPLTAIKFRLFSLKKSLPVALADNEDTTVIADEINRLERIVKDFLQFARPSDPELVNLPAARLIEQVHALLRSPLEKAAIEVKFDIQEEVWVRADPQQLKQVLINLVQNAAESIGRDGTITLRVSGDEAHLAGERKPVAILAITDTGKGIPEEVQKRLFDPFFTTKDGGTGLGLPTAARIVDKHGGELRYETHPNRGATFEVVLPRVTEHES
jgi:signal transduction histidine kinase